MIPLNGPAAGIANEDHDVSQNTTGPLLNVCGWPRSPLDLTPGEMGVLTEREKQFNGGNEVIQAVASLLFEVKEIVPASLHFRIAFGPFNGMTRRTNDRNATGHVGNL